MTTYLCILYSKEIIFRKKYKKVNYDITLQNIQLRYYRHV